MMIRIVKEENKMGRSTKKKKVDQFDGHGIVLIWTKDKHSIITLLMYRRDIEFTFDSIVYAK